MESVTSVACPQDRDFFSLLNDVSWRSFLVSSDLARPLSCPDLRVSQSCFSFFADVVWILIVAALFYLSATFVQASHRNDSVSPFSSLFFPRFPAPMCFRLQARSARSYPRPPRCPLLCSSSSLCHRTCLQLLMSHLVSHGSALVISLILC